MAEAAVKYVEYQYAATGTYGGAARRYAVPLEQPAEQPAAIPRVVPREKPRRRFLSAPSVIGFLTVITLGCVYLFLNAQLTVVLTELYAEKPLYLMETETAASDEENKTKQTRTVGLQTRRDELVSKSRELKIEYERVFDLGAVEKYATERLGMVKAPKRQSSNGNLPDKAVIPAETGNSGILGRVLEYFSGV